MSQLRLQSINELDYAQRGYAGRRVHEMVMDPTNQERLRDRGLLSVIKRHTISMDRSVQSMNTVQRLVADRAMAAFVVIDETRVGRNAVVGMATAQPDLELVRQRLPLPAKLTRNQLLSEPVDVPGANVAAWIDHRVGDASEQVDEYAQLYTFLARSTVGPVWALTPEGSAKHGHLDALEAAGYEPQGGWERYDDQEAEWSPAPHSLLWVAGVEIA